MGRTGHHVEKQSGRCIKTLHLKNCSNWNEVYEVIPTLSHPLIPKVYSCTKKGYEMEWVEGVSLGLYHFEKRNNYKFFCETVSLISHFFLYCQSITKTINDKECVLVPIDCNPRNIIVSPDNKIHIIDLDQFRFYSSPRNTVEYFKYFLNEYIKITQ